ncbi:MAG TPA: DinB family protein [Acidobacteriaceae bacterium]
MAIQRMKLVVAAAALMLMVGSEMGVQAQPTAPAPPAAGSPVDPAKSFDAALTRVENLWMGAAQAMPADKYDFAPSAAAFAPGQKVQFDGVRTFAQIVTHTIQANYSYFSRVGGVKPDVDTKAIGDLKSKDDIVKALAATFAFAHKAVANVTAANAFLSVGGPQTPASAFAGAVGHAEDEYGQAVEYLRMNAIVPPASETKPKT